MSRKKDKRSEKPQVNEELDGFDIQINEFGEIVATYDIKKLNNFLDEKVDDKKFRGIDVVKRDGKGKGKRKLKKSDDEAAEE